MTDATNRKLDVDRTDDREIARDDPLFELSQIIGFARPEEPRHSELDEQIDLEGELLRELESYPSFKPVDRAPEPAPAPMPEPQLPEIEEEIAPLEDFAPEIEPVFEEPIEAVDPVEEPKSLATEADTLESELMELLGGIGERVSMPWSTSEPKAAEPAAPPMAREAIPEAAESPQVPASPPFWFSDDSVEDEQPQEMANDEDSEILDAFESAMNEGFSLNFEEGAREEVVEEPAAYQPPHHDERAYSQPQYEAPAEPVYEEPSYDEPAYEEEAYAEPAYEEAAYQEPAYAQPAHAEPSYVEPAYEEHAASADAPAEDEFEFDLDLEDGFADETDYALAQPAAEESFASEIEAVADEISARDAGAVPVLETSEMMAGEMEAMAPLDLPALPEVEDRRPTAVDIERELDAALSGYDHFDNSGAAHTPNPAMRHAAAAAATAAVPADTRLDFDIDAFEDDLARDLEFVNHDMTAQDDDVDFVAEDETYGDGYAEPVDEQPRSRRGMIIAAVVGGIAILGAIGAFGLATSDNGVDGEPVLVKADPEPVKIVPEDPGGKQVPNQDRAVYGEVDGKGTTAPTQETLVSTSEEPIDLTGTGEPVLPTGVFETPKGEDRLLPDAAGSGEAMASAESPTAVLEPRRVRTVIVKPDGTLVANPEPVPAPAPAAAQPAATQPAAVQPNNGGVRSIDMAAQPASVAAAQPEAQAGFTAAPAQPTETVTAPAAAPSNDSLRALAEAQPQQPAAAAPQAVAAPAAQPIRTPGTIPERPTDQPVTIVNGQRPQVALAQPPAAPAPAAVQTQASGGYAVQIASQPSSELAQQTAQDLSRQYAGTLGGRAISIQAAQIDGRGTFYRVRVAASDRQDAIALCEAYKRAGGSCFVAK